MTTSSTGGTALERNMRTQLCETADCLEGLA